MSCPPDTLREAREALQLARRKLAQAAQGLKRYRQREVDEAWQRVRSLERHGPPPAPEAAPPPAGPLCTCGAPLLQVKGSLVCSRGEHDG